MFVNSGGGTAANLSEFDEYAFALREFGSTPNPPNTPAPNVVVIEDDRDADSHGLVLTKRGHSGRVADRTGNRIVVIGPEREAKVGEFSLLGPLSADPTADLLDVSRSGAYVLASLRGPTLAVRHNSRIKARGRRHRQPAHAPAPVSMRARPRPSRICPDRTTNRSGGRDSCFWQRNCLGAPVRVCARC